jgi:hypothetical protein
VALVVEPPKKNKSANFAPENKSLARRSLPKGSRDLIPPPQSRRRRVGFLYLIPTFCVRRGRPVRATRSARVLIPPIGCRALKRSGACPLPPKKFSETRGKMCVAGHRSPVPLSHGFEPPPRRILRCTSRPCVEMNIESDVRSQVYCGQHVLAVHFRL